MADAGITLEKLGYYKHLKSHEDVALAVIGGYFDAGGVKEEIFTRYETRGIRVLARSPRMPEHVFVTRSDMDPRIISILRKGMLKMGADSTKTPVFTSIKENFPLIASVAVVDEKEEQTLGLIILLRDTSTEDEMDHLKSKFLGNVSNHLRNPRFCW